MKKAFLVCPFVTSMFITLCTSAHRGNNTTEQHCLKREHQRETIRLEKERQKQLVRELKELKKQEALLVAKNAARERELAQQKKLRKDRGKPKAPKDDERKEYGIAFTLKNGYFYPQECVLRKIFDHCGGKGGYWVEGAMRYNFWKGMNVEASGSYFKRDGRALCSIECTEVKIPTLGLGLKYFFNCADFCDDCSNYCKRFSFFLGAGLRIFFYRARNNSPYVIQCIEKTTVGGMINAGIEFNVYKGFFIDLFVDYNFRKLSLGRGDFCNSCGNDCCAPCCTSCITRSSTSCRPCCCPSCCFDTQIGGFVAGIGLGYKF